MCRQAQMPGSFAGSPASQLLAQLSSHASFLAAVRRGTPVLAKEAVFDDRTVTLRRSWPHKLRPGACTVFPAGEGSAQPHSTLRAAVDSAVLARTVAALAYTNGDFDGLELAREDPRGRWQTQRPDGPSQRKDTALLNMTGHAGKGWAASGRLLASLHKWRPGARHDPLEAQVYDVQQRCMLSRQIIPASETLRSICSPTRFSDCETLAAACAVCTRSECRVLVVCGAAQDFVQLVPLPSGCVSWTWLPGCASILLCHDHSLARVDLGPGAASALQEVQAEWVQAPGRQPISHRAYLDVLPCSQAAVTLHCAGVEGHTASVELVFRSCTGDLARLDLARTQLQLPSYPSPHCQLRVQLSACLSVHCGGLL